MDSTPLKEGLAWGALELSVFLECFHHCLLFPCLRVKEKNPGRQVYTGRGDLNQA